MSRTYPHLQFAEDVLRRMDLPVTRQNLQAMLAWQQAEGGHTQNNADWNPLNTSRPMGGAGSIDADGVRSYPNYATGVRATVETLRLGFYGAIRAALAKGDSAAAVERAVVASPWAESRYGGSFGTTPWARAYMAERAASVRRMTATPRGRRNDDRNDDRAATPPSRRGGEARTRRTGGSGGLRPWAMPRDGKSGDTRIVVDRPELEDLVRGIDGHLATADGVERRVRSLAGRLEPGDLRLVDAASERELHRTMRGLTDAGGRNLPALLRALSRDEAFVVSALADVLRVDAGGRGRLLDRILRTGRDGDDDGGDRHRRRVAAILAGGGAGARRPGSTAPSNRRSQPADRRPSTAVPARQRMGSATPPASIRRHGNGRVPPSAMRSIGGDERLAAPAAEAFTAMRAAAGRAGIRLPVNDSYRSYAEQVAIAEEKGLYSASNRTGAAVPGTSNHGWGLSVDINVNSASSRWLAANAARWGYFNDVPGEPWHWTHRPAR